VEKAFIVKRGQKVFFDLPAGWHLLTFADLKDRGQAADVHALAVEALKHPVASPPLRERLSPSDTVAILIEDLTRASPKGRGTGGGPRSRCPYRYCHCLRNPSRIDVR